MMRPAPGYMVDPRYIQRLERDKEIVGRLCATLQEYLCTPIDAALEEANRKPPRAPRPTLEHLNQAQSELDKAERAISGVQRMSETWPDEMREGFLDSQMPLLERQIQPLRDMVSMIGSGSIFKLTHYPMIQAAMEEPEPDGPWDGSHQISTLCAQCACSFDQVHASIPALKVALKASSWGRDADGDHICPKCAALAETSDPAETGSQLQEKGESD